MSILILQQSLSICYGAAKELTDVGVSSKTVLSLKLSVEPLLGDSPLPKLVDVRDIRAVRAGSTMFVDCVALVKSDATLSELNTIESTIAYHMVDRKREIKEVRVKFRPQETQNSV